MGFEGRKDVHRGEDENSGGASLGYFFSGNVCWNATYLIYESTEERGIGFSI